MSACHVRCSVPSSPSVHAKILPNHRYKSYVNVHQWIHQQITDNSWISQLAGMWPRHDVSVSRPGKASVSDGLANTSVSESRVSVWQLGLVHICRLPHAADVKLSKKFNGCIERLLNGWLHSPAERRLTINKCVHFLYTSTIKYRVFEQSSHRICHIWSLWIHMVSLEWAPLARRHAESLLHQWSVAGSISW